MRVRRWAVAAALGAAAGVVGVSVGQGDSGGGDEADRLATLDAIIPEQPIDRHEGLEPFEYFGGLRVDERVPTPESVIGHELGERFTRHHEIVDYFEALDESSDHVVVSRYGESHQGRPLLTATIGSRENLARLEEILAANRELTDPRGTSEARAREIIDSNPAIVWLSFGVHGNEASVGEAAMATAYALAAGQNEELRRIRDEVIVVIDPALNPDGRMRYVGWYENTVGTGGPNSGWDAAERDEPWPSGRTNHYLFDLNRDWLWLTQPESEARIVRYVRYKPQLHIDVHEQGFQSPYFFGAGDDPWNLNIPDETRAWVELYGDANAKLFDARGLVYATKERFDYLYPGYGKVLPVYHGAVGMLTEQAGHGFAGLAVDVHDEYVLTLRERANNHFLTSMNYVETTAANREGQLRRFWNFHKTALEPGDGPMAFVISAENDAALLREVKRLADQHGIEIERLGGETTLRGLVDYRSGEEVDRTTVPAGSWVIRADQPMGRLVRALFERTTDLTTNDTYDITGWSLPVAFGLTAWESPRAIRGGERLERTPASGRVTGDGRYAVLVDAQQSGFPSAVGAAMELELFWRYTGAEIEVDGTTFAPGSMIVHRIRNSEAEVNDFLERLADRGVDAHLAGSGLTSAGPVLGTNENGIAKAPRIALLRGEPTDPYSFGELWWFLDEAYGIPYTTINVDSFARVDLDDYNVLVVPSLWGSMDSALGESGAEEIREWVRGGGTLVTLGSSSNWAERSVLRLDEEEEKDEESDEEEVRESDLSFEEREARGVDRRVPGSMLAAGVDTTHPLAAGAPAWVGSVKRSGDALTVTDDVFVVARYDENPLVSGHLSEERRAEIAGTPMMAHHAMGRGHVVLIDESVTIRGFQRGVVRLVMNAMLYGPTL